jgi:hypothetical protein
MNGWRRGPITLLAAAVAGGLVWVATRFDDHANGGYWAAYLVIAAGGLLLAASQLGVWTKGGRVVVSPGVLLLAFVPALVVVGWIVVAGQPHGSTTRSHVLAWSHDIGVRGVVTSLVDYVAVLAFGLGAMFGLSFDTTGPSVPRTAVIRDWRSQPADEAPTEHVEREPVGAGAVRERVG